MATSFQDPLCGYDSEEGKVRPMKVDSEGKLYVVGSTESKPYSDIQVGDYVPTSDNPEQIFSSVIPNTASVLIQAKNTNTNIIYIGDATKQTIELKAGQSVTIPISDVTKLYVKRTTGSTGDGINYIVGIY